MMHKRVNKMQQKKYIQKLKIQKKKKKNNSSSLSCLIHEAKYPHCTWVYSLCSFTMHKHLFHFFSFIFTFFALEKNKKRKRMWCDCNDVFKWCDVCSCNCGCSSCSGSGNGVTDDDWERLKPWNANGM